MVVVQPRPSPGLGAVGEREPGDPREAVSDLAQERAAVDAAEARVERHRMDRRPLVERREGGGAGEPV